MNPLSELRIMPETSISAILSREKAPSRRISVSTRVLLPDTGVISRLGALQPESAIVSMAKEVRVKVMRDVHSNGVSFQQAWTQSYSATRFGYIVQGVTRRKARLGGVRYQKGVYLGQ